MRAFAKPQHIFSFSRSLCRKDTAEATRELMMELIARDYETNKQKNKHSVYAALLRECEERGLPAPSYKTFAKAIDSRPGYEQTYKRQGSRAAYSREPFYFELELTTPRHGDRPFEICHLDHTELDIELVCSLTGRNLGRPWASFLTDALSRRLLAVVLLYQPPSRVACMLTLRECVRRFGRFPQTLVVDGGSEFLSTYFESLLACYECAKKTRPPAKARFGSVVERLFGTANTQFVYKQQTGLLFHLRILDGGNQPQRKAFCRRAFAGRIGVAKLGHE